MMTPQLTEQYGHVERVSLARAILSARSSAYAGCRSKPKTDAATPPTVVSFRKSRRVACMVHPRSKTKDSTQASYISLQDRKVNLLAQKKRRYGPHFSTTLCRF